MKSRKPAAPRFDASRTRSRPAEQLPPGPPVQPITVNPAIRTPISERLRIAIVGGGPGGLFTAWLLEQLAAARVEITILEATQRLGGKLLSPMFSKAPIRYEAGAAEFYDYSPIGPDPLREIVEGFGLATVPLGGGTVQVEDRPLANADDVRDAFGAAAHADLLAFDAWARSAMTPREFYDSGTDHAGSAAPCGRFDRALARTTGSRAVRRYLEAMIHSDLATPPATTSVAYGLQNYLMNDPAYMRLYGIAGGNEQLVGALAARIDAAVRLATRVEEVAADAAGRLRLVLREAGVRRAETFDIAVLALPMDALLRLAFPDDRLGAAMQRHLRQHDHPAHYVRVTLLLDRPLERHPGDDAYLMLDAFGGCCLYLESAREPAGDRGVLGWLIAGSAAETMASWADESLLDAVLETLPEPLRWCREHVLEPRVHRWVSAVSGLPGGWQPLPVDRRHQPAPDSHPGLFVVGDYLYDSTLNGVLDSADHVAGWVAALACEGRRGAG